MPTFSLIGVDRLNDDHTRASGNWIQNHIGTLETALEVARQTNAVNRNALTIAVVDEVPSPVPILDYWTDRKVLGLIQPS